MIFLYVVIREKILRSLMFNYKDQKWVGREEKKQPWASHSLNKSLFNVSKYALKAWH